LYGKQDIFADKSFYPYQLRLKKPIEAAAKSLMNIRVKIETPL
jgi:hypothetical protein